MVTEEGTKRTRVRMYRQGLGDCFLVSLPNSSEKMFHILIDCGIHAAVQGNLDWSKRIASDLAESTDGELGLVIITSTHWDHVSGFVQAREIFHRFRIDEVWLPWTEDPSDSVAESLRLSRDRDIRGLRVLASQLAATGDEKLIQSGESLRTLLNSFGPEGGVGSRGAIDELRDHPSCPRVQYLRPGDSVRRLTDSHKADVYVIGLLPETSSTGSEPNAAVALYAASGGLNSTDLEAANLCDAFDRRYRLASKNAMNIPLFEKQYFNPKDSWRRLDSDWMGPAFSLSLDTYSRTKDQSLTIAIELDKSGHVLMFQSDSPTKDWLGLRYENWSTNKPSITVKDLLKRTLLFKVGERGASTETVGLDVLDAMINPDLVAMLPASGLDAEQIGWSLPDEHLIARVTRATRGRLLRSDHTFDYPPEGMNSREWQSFQASIQHADDDLYVDFFINP